MVYDPVHDVLWEAAIGRGVKKNDQPWKIVSNLDVLTFTYDRSFEKHRGGKEFWTN
ncbi:MAG: hypothetical protein CM15mP130_1960 [Verrucomicrobiota bacterium]|nr:MAG: hypothetical protein CM15mP130_1960 [Verrucomicrobiota bacterium]